MIKKHTLKNGLKVIVSPMQGTKAVTVLVLVGVGSRHEEDSHAGISHFLEHVLFKGTAKRPSTLAISKELDRVGAEYNAFTAKDKTGFYVKISSDKIEIAMDVLSDILTNSKFDEKEIEKEKGTIIEEINMYEDNPMMQLDIMLEELVFQDNPLARDEGGTKKTVRSVTRNKIISYKNNHYLPSNTVVCLSGDISDKQARALSEEYFNKRYIKKSNKKVSYKKFKSSQKKATVKILNKQTEQANLAMGFHGPSVNDDEIYAASLLAVILGGGLSSRLINSIRDKRGLCYYIRAGINTYQDIGNFYIKAGLDKSKIHEAITLILKELTLLKNKGITAEELKRAKENIKGRMVLDLEESSAVAEWYGRQQIMTGKTKTPEQNIEDIMSVSKKEVDKLAKNIFQSKKINLVLIGPYEDQKSFIKLLKI